MEPGEVHLVPDGGQARLGEGLFGFPAGGFFAAEATSTSPDIGARERTKESAALECRPGSYTCGSFTASFAQTTSGSFTEVKCNQ
jgi:hypothetical protein